MKLLYFTCIFLLLGLAHCRSIDDNKLVELSESTDKSDENVSDRTKSYKTHFKEKCLKHGGPNAFNELMKAIDNATLCIKNLLPNDDKVKQFDDTELCTVGKNHIKGCFDTIVDELKICSHEQEQYLPQFTFDAINEVADFFCKDDLVNLDRLFSFRSMSCIYRLMQVNETIFEGCDEDISGTMIDGEEIFTKIDICKGLERVETCVGNIIQNECPRNPVFKNIMTGVYSSMRKPCEKKTVVDIYEN